MSALSCSKFTGKRSLFILQWQLQILLEKLATRGSLCSKSWHIMMKDLQIGKKKEREGGRERTENRNKNETECKVVGLLQLIAVLLILLQAVCHVPQIKLLFEEGNDLAAKCTIKYR